MGQDASSEYLRNTVMTASPEQLQLMLYDGAIRFGRQARDALLRKDYETSCEKLLRTQRIVVQLETGLRPEINPALCEQLASLYQFIYQRLVDANMKRDAVALDEALQIIEHQRETWRMLIDKVRGGETSATPNTSLQPSKTHDQTPALSVQG